MSGTAVEELDRTLLHRWNERDADGYGELSTDDGSVVGFDGSSMASPGARNCIAALEWRVGHH